MCRRTYVAINHIMQTSFWMFLYSHFVYWTLDVSEIPFCIAFAELRLLETWRKVIDGSIYNMKWLWNSHFNQIELIRCSQSVLVLVCVDSTTFISWFSNYFIWMCRRSKQANNNPRCCCWPLIIMTTAIWYLLVRQTSVFTVQLTRRCIRHPDFYAIEFQQLKYSFRAIYLPEWDEKRQMNGWMRWKYIFNWSRCICIQYFFALIMKLRRKKHKWIWARKYKSGFHTSSVLQLSDEWKS